MISSGVYTVLRGLRRTLGPLAYGGLSDGQLLNRWTGQHDEAALELLVWRHGPMVLGVCRRILRHQQDAEDAFQATFLTLVHRAAAIRNPDALAPWLHRVAYRAAQAVLANQKRHSLPLDRSEDIPANDTASKALPEDFRSALDEELNLLPEKYRRPFLLCYLEGQTNEEAAQVLGWPKGTVATRLAWARTRLRSRLARRGLALSAAALTLALERGLVQAMPHGLAGATVQSAISFTMAGTTLATPAVLLAEGIMNAMLMTRLKIGALLLITISLLAAGVGLAAVQGGNPKAGEPERHRAQLAPFREQEDKPEAEEDKERRHFRGRLVRWNGGTKESEAAVAAGLHWLSLHQHEDGHWSLDHFHTAGNCSCGDRGTTPNDLAGTAFALLPFLGAGITHQSKGPDGAYARNVAGGLNYLLKCQMKTGNFGTEMYSNSLATLAVCQAYGLTGDPALKGSAQKALDFIVGAQHVGGGWRYAPGQPGDTSVTGWQIQTLRVAELAGLQVPPQTLQNASLYLDSCQAEDGTYGYTGRQGSRTMTAMGVLCRELLGTSLRDPVLVRGLNHLASWEPGTQNSLYFDFHAGQALFLGGGKEWNVWNAKGRELLIVRQDKGGKANGDHQKGSWSPAGDQFGSQGRLMSTSLALLTLEVYYRTDLLLERQAPRPLKGQDREALWDRLKGDDALQIRQTAWALLRHVRHGGQSLTFLASKLQPIPPFPPVDFQRLQKIIRDLDSDEFAVRERATKQLEQCGEQEIGLLQKVLQGQPSPEVRQRLTRVLDKHAVAVGEERRRLSWALEILERMESAEANKLLERLAGGAPGAWQTEEAKAALQRQKEKR